ncbi:glycosyltransferase [Mammaliicoccus sp. J-M40]|uniref:glycosyltransferase n=1 Tax=Mammaliicoccus sp. J-M40 TaxID=2898699 RepID=UPI001EFB2174|nr:glycosyltransferase [Mammaliicoccus sp. J-M40]
MRILNIVSSSVVTDPRVTKQLDTISSLTKDYLAIGKNNELATKERMEEYKYNFKLFGKTSKNENIIQKIFRRSTFGYCVIRTIYKYRPDIIHANDFDVLFMVKISGYKKAKVVFDAHEIYSKNMFVDSKPILSRIVQKLEKKFTKNIHAFITVSNAAKDYYLSQGYKKEPIVITNTPIKEDIVLKDIKSNNFEVIYQGQLVSNRGYEEFLKAGQFINDETVKLIIRGFGHLEEELKSTKIKEKINNVYVEDPVEMSQLVKSMSTSDVGVVLTKPTSINFEYTVSNKIFECLHAGLPVILSPVKEHIYLNDKYNFGFILDEVTPQKIAEAILKLKENPKIYQELKENAIKASEVLTWQKEGKKLLDIYEEALK